MWVLSMNRFPEVEIRASEPVGPRNTVYVHIGLKDKRNLSKQVQDAGSCCSGCDLNRTQFSPVGRGIEARCDGFGNRTFANMAIQANARIDDRAVDPPCGADPVALYRQASQKI